MRILIVEDDQKISNFIAKGLKEESMTVDVADRGDTGLYMAEIVNYDVIVLDWMLPGISGIELCKQIRYHQLGTPILMLTARGDVDDRVEGLESGADDYLSKPFAFSELVARIKALHRRHANADLTLLQAEDLSLNTRTRVVNRNNKTIELSTKEYMLLEFLLRNKNRIVTNTMMIENIWNMQEHTQSNILSVTIYNLRNKVDNGFEKKLIKTIRGSGYCLESI